jgi:hypothetical protein
MNDPLFGFIISLYIAFHCSITIRLANVHRDPPNAKFSILLNGLNLANLELD